MKTSRIRHIKVSGISKGFSGLVKVSALVSSLATIVLAVRECAILYKELRKYRNDSFGELLESPCSGDNETMDISREAKTVSKIKNIHSGTKEDRKTKKLMEDIQDEITNPFDDDDNDELGFLSN